MAGLLDYLEGIGETGATLGTGLLSGVVGAPYGLFKGITSGRYGSPEAVRIAEEEAKKCWSTIDVNNNDDLAGDECKILVQAIIKKAQELTKKYFKIIKNN